MDSSPCAHICTCTRNVTTERLSKLGPANHVISCFINLVVTCVHKLMDGVLKSGCQSHYNQKLEHVGMLLSCVPYLESNSHRDMSLWPRKELSWLVVPKQMNYERVWAYFSLKNWHVYPGAAAFMAAAQSVQFLRVSCLCNVVV